jgi:hypothetical protein
VKGEVVLSAGKEVLAMEVDTGAARRIPGGC